MSSSRGTEPGRSGFWRCAAFQTAIGGIGGGVHAYPAKALATGGAKLLPTVAVSCGIGTAEGAAAVAGTAYLLPDQDSEITPTLVGAALGCATAGIIGSGSHVTRVHLHNARTVPTNASYAARYLQQLRTADAANPLVKSLRLTGDLPPNYVTKADAIVAGWAPGKALDNYVPGGQLGGDVFENSDGLLPSAQGRMWFEADVGLTAAMSRAKQPGTRIVWSDDGLAYVTADHYKSFYQLPNWGN